MKNNIFVKLMCVYLSCALALMGCGKDFLVKKDQNPVIRESETVSKGNPDVTREKTQEASVLFMFPEPKEPDIKKLSLSKKYTFYAAQERIKKDGGEWKFFVNNKRVVLRNYGVKNGQRQLFGPGYLESGHLFAAKFLNEDNKGNRIYQAKFIGQCGNEIPEGDLMVLETPVVITEKTVTINTVTKTKETVYTNVDYKPALWAGLGGILLGLGLGWLFWFKTGETIVAAAGSQAGIPCPPGIPAPRPPVP